jgi:hypothetical protein
MSANKVQMYLTLKAWMDIGIASDIINCPDHRPEYAPYVLTQLLKQISKKQINLKQIPDLVAEQLESEIILLGEKVTLWAKVKNYFKR